MGMVTEGTAPAPADPRGRAFQATDAINTTTISPRLRRLATALLQRPRTVRELCDTIPTNNPAEYVRQLRQEFRLTIPCEHVSFTTIDGTASWHGKYHLTVDDRQKLCSVFNMEAA
jgi:hypothetical protein